MSIDLKCIKHRYGEKMMHLCRKLFPTILEEEGLLFKTLRENFNYSKDLADDLISNSMVTEFKNYVFSLINHKKHLKDTNKTVRELLDEQNYILYECKTNEDIEQFRKYYAPGEALCTFTDDRLKDSYVFFAVKKDVDNIKREHFDNPKREDPYGTSVISIQFTRGEINTLGIMNRYNHNVENADATFSNNLENINPGLTKAFEREYGLNIYSNKRAFDLPGYIMTMEGKYYKYNFEKNGIYYCPNNIIIDHYKAKHYDKEKYIITDYFVLDLQNKKISLYDKNIKDSFIDGLNNIRTIKVLNEKEEDQKQIIINDDIEIILNKNNQIVSYKNPHIKTLDNSFLGYRRDSVIEKLDFPNVEEIGDDFFEYNKTLKEIKLDNVREIGDCFIRHNQNLRKIYAPKVIRIKNNFLENNENITSINFPRCIEVGNNFLLRNKCINTIYLDNVRRIGNNFMPYNENLTELVLPNVEEIKASFMLHNESIRKIYLPNVKIIGESFMYCNSDLDLLFMPEVTVIDKDFCRYNKELKTLEFPNLVKIGSRFMQNNNKIRSVHFPNVKTIGYDFMNNNCKIERVKLDKAEKIGKGFLENAVFLKELYLPIIDAETKNNLPEFLLEKIKKQKRKIKLFNRENG